MIGECKNGMKREAINVSKAHYVMLHIDLMKIANTFCMKRHFLSVWARCCQLISMLLLAATKSSVQMLFCVRTSVDGFFCCCIRTRCHSNAPFDERKREGNQRQRKLNVVNSMKAHFISLIICYNQFTSDKYTQSRFWWHNNEKINNYENTHSLTHLDDTVAQQS